MFLKSTIYDVFYISVVDLQYDGILTSKLTNKYTDISLWDVIIYPQKMVIEVVMLRTILNIC